LVASGYPERIIERYCWRCWPAAQERAHEQAERSFAASMARMRDMVPAAGSTERTKSSGALTDVMAWHWVLNWGTQRRFRAHMQRIRDVAHQPAG
jgi:hypothetical protein